MGWGLVAVQVGIMLVSYFLRKTLLAPELPNPGKAGGARAEFPTIEEGTPIPIVYGTDIVRAPGLLYFGNVDQTNVLWDLDNSGSGETHITNYSAFLLLGVCLTIEDPNSRQFKGIYLDDKQIWSGGEITSTPDEDSGIDIPYAVGGGDFAWWGQPKPPYDGDPQGGFVKGKAHLANGNFGQSVGNNVSPGDAAFSYLRNLIDTELAIDSPASYRGICCLTLSRGYTSGNPDLNDFRWGSSSQPPSIGIEMRMIPGGLGVVEVDGTVGPDANPAEVIYDILISSWGRCGLDPALVDLESFVDAANTLNTEAHGISLVIDSSVEALTVIEGILEQIDGVLYYDAYTGLIKLKLLRPEGPDGLLAMDEGDVIRVEQYSSTLWPETYNQVRLSFPDRDKHYRERVHSEIDQANQYFQAKAVALTLSYPGVKTKALAAKIAARELRFHSVPQAKATLVCKRVAARLRPGDAFIWYSAAYGFPFQLVSPGNTTGMIMRVETIDYGTPESPEIKIECVRDLFELGEPTFHDAT